MICNYRIYHDTDLHVYEIRQVFYDGEDIIATESAMAPDGHSIEELKQDLDQMVSALNRPVLEPDEIKDGNVIEKLKKDLDQKVSALLKPEETKNGKQSCGSCCRVGECPSAPQR